MKKTRSKLFGRSIALVLSVLMCISSFGITAFAANTTKNLKDGDFTVTIDKDSTAKKVSVDFKTADEGFHDFVSEPYVHNYTALMHGNHGLSAVINLTDKDGNKVDYKGEMTVKYTLPDDWDINYGVKVAWVGTGTWGNLLFSSGQIATSYVSGRTLSFTVNYNNTDDNSDSDYPMNGNRVLIVQKLAKTDVTSLSDGVYDVNLAMLSDVQNESLSMASNTVDRNAKLIVNDGKTYLNINFNMGSVMFMPAFANKVYSVNITNGGDTGTPRYGKNIPGTVNSYYDSDEALRFAFDLLKNGTLGSNGSTDAEIQEEVDTTVLQNGIKPIHNVTLDVTDSIQSNGTFLIGFCSDIMDSLYDGDYGSDAGYNTTNFLVGNPIKTDETADNYVVKSTADKSELENVFKDYINACDPATVLRKVYTDESYNKYFVPAWQQVYQAYTYVGATQTQINNAVKVGKEALSNLVALKEGDGVNLTWNVNFMLKKAKAVDKTLYTTSSYENMTSIVSKAQELLDKGNEVYAKDLSAVYYELEDAYNALALKATDFTALENAINDVKDTSLDGYTDKTIKAFKNELAKAQSMLESKDISEAEIEQEIKALYNAKNALSTEDANDGKLKDGIYKINLSMLKINRKDPSMAGGAVNSIAKLEVVNGEYYLTLDFKGMTITNKYGYLSKLWYYDDGYTYDKNGEPQGKLTEAETLTTQKNADGTDVIDMYNDENNLYPDLIKIKLTDTALNDEDGYVPLRVMVPIMEAIAKGNGEHNVLMKLEWDSVTETTDEDPDIVPDKPDEQSSALDYTDSKTGVKVSADKGVFDEGVQVVVTEITDGTDYTNAANALEDTGKKFKLYNVKFLDKDGNEVTPNGTVSIGIPTPAGYDASKLSVFRINDGSSKTVVKGTFADGMYTVVTKTGGNYALAESGSTITDKQNSDNGAGSSVDNANKGTASAADNAVKTGDNSPLTICLVAMLAACAVLAVIDYNKKRKSQGE